MKYILEYEEFINITKKGTKIKLTPGTVLLLTLFLAALDKNANESLSESIASDSIKLIYKTIMSNLTKKRRRERVNVSDIENLFLDVYKNEDVDKCANNAIAFIEEYRKLAKDYTNKSGNFLDEKSLKEGLNDYLNENIKNIEINVDYYKNDVDISNGQKNITRMVPEWIYKFFDKGTRQSNILSADVTQHFFTNQLSLNIYYIDKLSNIVYDDKKWIKTKTRLSFILTHEFTHAAQFIQKKTGDNFYNPSDMVNYLTSKHEMEAYAKGTAHELLSKGYDKTKFLNDFNAGIKLPANSLTNYYSTFGKDPNFIVMSKLRDNIAGYLP